MKDYFVVVAYKVRALLDGTEICAKVDFIEFPSDNESVAIFETLMAFDGLLATWYI